jgi:hypothetical protein
MSHQGVTVAKGEPPSIGEFAVSLQYLKDAVASGDTEKLIRYVRLHLGDGNEQQGRKEIDKAWIEALKPLLDVPSTDREFILETLTTKDRATLAHLFFHLHFYFVKQSGEWIHDGNL